MDDPPTPHYNASLLLELGGRERHLVTLYSALHNSPGLIDAVLLCKVWARQRGLDKVLFCCLSYCSLSFFLLWWLLSIKTLLHSYIITLGNEFQYLYSYTNQLYVIIITSCQLYVKNYVMLRVFCVQGVGGLSGFHFSMLVAWLCSQRRLNAHMSCYQTFRVVMQTFVASDWTTKGIAMSQVTVVRTQFIQQHVVMM